MIQIIGFLGCLYLFVKALELFGKAQALRNTDKEWTEGMSDEERKEIEHANKGSLLTQTGAWFALIGAPLFAFWLMAQGGEMQQAFAPKQSFSECLREADTAAEISAC